MLTGFKKLLTIKCLSYRPEHKAKGTPEMKS